MTFLENLRALAAAWTSPEHEHDPNMALCAELLAVLIKACEDGRMPFQELATPMFITAIAVADMLDVARDSEAAGLPRAARRVLIEMARTARDCPVPTIPVGPGEG